MPKQGKSFTARMTRFFVTSLLFIGMGAGSAWYYHNSVSQAAQEQPVIAQGAHITTPAPQQTQNPHYITLDPFTATIADENAPRRALFVGFTLQVQDEASAKRIREHMPELRSRILMELSNESPSKLATREGREDMLRSVSRVASFPFSTNQQQQVITNVLITDFIIQ